jgi:hypothetical protein
MSETREFGKKTQGILGVKSQSRLMTVVFELGPYQII